MSGSDEQDTAVVGGICPRCKRPVGLLHTVCERPPDRSPMRRLRDVARAAGLARWNIGSADTTQAMLAVDAGTAAVLAALRDDPGLLTALGWQVETEYRVKVGRISLNARSPEEVCALAQKHPGHKPQTRIVVHHETDWRPVAAEEGTTP